MHPEPRIEMEAFACLGCKIKRSEGFVNPRDVQLNLHHERRRSISHERNQLIPAESSSTSSTSLTATTDVMSGSTDLQSGNSSQSTTFFCTTCQIAFQNGQEQRVHMKDPWQYVKSTSPVFCHRCESILIFTQRPQYQTAN